MHINPRISIERETKMKLLNRIETLVGYSLVLASVFLAYNNLPIYVVGCVLLAAYLITNHKL